MGHIGFADLTVSFHRRLLLHQVGDVGVNVQRGCPENVTNTRRWGLYIRTDGNRHRGEGMTEGMEPHAPKSYVIPSPKYYCFPMGQPGQSPLYIPYYSDNPNKIIPIPLILFRNGGILSLDWSDAHVYDCEAGCGKMGSV